jgi:hypothetical protein
MINRFVTHIRLISRLLNDPRVSIWIKIVFFLLPVSFVFLPLFFEIPDIIPVVGFFDDLIILGLGSLLFRRLAPAEVVSDHLQAMLGCPQVEALRHPDEDYYLGGGLLWLILVILLLGSILSYLWLGFSLVTYSVRRKRHRRLRRTAEKVTAETAPGLFQALERHLANLPRVGFEVWVHGGKSPKTAMVKTSHGYCWMISRAMLNLQPAEELACDASRQAAHVLLGQWGLLSLIHSDPTGLSKLIFRKWLRCAEASAGEVADKIFYCGKAHIANPVEQKYATISS